jgi:toxin-antitoxin system PIN domain toxin
MPIALLDVNVLFALAWEKHLHHHAAHHWFNKLGQAGWARCAMTECGFVRLSSNRKVAFIENSPFEASAMLSRITSHAGHVFWPDDLQLTDAIRGYSSIQLRGHLQVADAYLLSLAIAHGGTLATFDRRAAALTPARNPGSVEIIPVQT